MSQTTDGPEQLRNRLFPIRVAGVVIGTETSSLQFPTYRWISPRIALLFLVFLGFALRCVPLVQNRCLWIDEAMLALNLIERSPQRLLEPLDWNQGAPAGFLLAEKACISVLGTSEWTLRLFPFTASVLGLIAFSYLSRRILCEQAAVLSTALMAISPALISYSAECKQYATDAVWTIMIFAAAIDLLFRQSGGRRWVMLGIVGAVAVWFSHSSVFVLGAVGSALFLDSLFMGDRRRVLACGATTAGWLSSFAFCYLTTLRHLGNNQYLLDYWAGHFLSLPPTSSGDLAWLLGHLSGFIDFPGGLGGTEIKAGGLAAAFFLVGLATQLRERWTIAAVLGGPAFFALMASGLHKYPFAGRLLLFLVPLLLLGVARGAWEISQAVRTQLPAASLVLIGILVAAPAIETYQQIRRPLRYEQITSIMEEVRQQWQPGDQVYLYYGAIPAYMYYTREQPFVPNVMLGTEFRENRTGYRDELRSMAGQPRVWLIFSHRHQAEESLLRAYAECLGECRQEMRGPGTAAFLFDFSSTPVPR